MKNDRDADDCAVRALNAGLGYGPTGEPKQLLDAIVAAERNAIRVTLAIPAVLLDYFRIESEKLGMSEGELMVRILETHRFADQRQQHLILAIARQGL